MTDFEPAFETHPDQLRDVEALTFGFHRDDSDE